MLMNFAQKASNTNTTLNKNYSFEFIVRSTCYVLHHHLFIISLIYLQYKLFIFCSARILQISQHYRLQCLLICKLKYETYLLDNHGGVNKIVAIKYYWCLSIRNVLKFFWNSTLKRILVDTSRKLGWINFTIS